jgi:ornithine carbamoyltransferase
LAACSGRNAAVEERSFKVTAISLDTQSTRKRVKFRVGFVCFGLNVFLLFGGMLGHVGPLLWMAAVHGLSNSPKQ